jgi:hypothetical protein
MMGKMKAMFQSTNQLSFLGGFEVSEIYPAWYKATFQGPVIFSSLNPAMAPQRPFFMATVTQQYRRFTPLDC